MRIHVIAEAKSNSTGPLTFLHTIMFHGESRRDGMLEIHAPLVLYGNDTRMPLEIYRAGQYVPPIFMNPPVLIVSDQVRNTLEGVPHIEFLQVEFKKLADLAMPNLGEEPDWRRTLPEEYFYDIPRLLLDSSDAPELHARIPAYYELLAPRVCDIRSEFPEAREIKVVGNDPNDPFEVYVCNRIFEEYPIQQTEVVLCHDAVFEKIAPFLDENYFDLKEISF